jgi:hypothetical protein
MGGGRGRVVVDRDQFRVSDDADPLGPPRVRCHQQQVRLTARAAWQRMEETCRPPDPGPASIGLFFRAHRKALAEAKGRPGSTWIDAAALMTYDAANEALTPQPLPLDPGGLVRVRAGRAG